MIDIRDERTSTRDAIDPATGAAPGVRQARRGKRPNPGPPEAWPPRPSPRPAGRLQ